MFECLQISSTASAVASPGNQMTESEISGRMHAMEEDVERGEVETETTKNGLPSYQAAMHCQPGQAQPCNYNFYEYPLPSVRPPTYSVNPPSLDEQQRQREDTSVRYNVQKLLCGILCALLFVWFAVMAYMILVHQFTSGRGDGGGKIP